MKVSIDDFQATAMRLLQTEMMSRGASFMQKYKHSTNDACKFQLAEKLLKSCSFTPDIVFEGKDAAMTEKVRKYGNELFAKGNLRGALQAYNKAICLAPWSSSASSRSDDKSFCLALNFGNRSAVFLREKRFTEALMDIDQALQLGYPKKSIKKLLVRKARIFLELDRFSDAVHCLGKEGVRLRACKKDDLTAEQPVEDMKEYLEVLKEANDKLASVPEGHKGKPLPSLKFPGAAEVREEMKKLSLAHGKHPVFPSISAGAAFKHTDRAGRYFVAEKAFKTGDVVLIEPCFVNAMEPACLATNCYNCMMWTDKPFPCMTCSAVVFCDSACASGTRAKLHTTECKFWKTLLGENGVGAAQLMAMRVVLMKSIDEWKEFSSKPPGNTRGEADAFSGIPNKKYFPNDYDNVFCLLKNSKKHNVGFVMLNAFFAVYVMKLLDEHYFPKAAPGVAAAGNQLDKRLRDYLGGIVLRHSLNFVTCDFMARELVAPCFDKENYFTMTAHAIHPTFELLNATCDPNLFAVHYGDLLVARAGRPIEKGEILCHPMLCPYMDSPYENRRQLLSTTQFYDCNCRPCKERWPVANVLLNMGAKGKTEFKCPDCGHKLGTQSEALQLLSKASSCPGCSNVESKKIVELIRGALEAPKKFRGAVGDRLAGNNNNNNSDGSGQLEEKLRVLAAAIDSAYSVTVPPASVLYQLRELMFKACLAAGNKRHDDLDQSGRIALEIAKIRLMSHPGGLSHGGANVAAGGLPQPMVDDDGDDAGCSLM